MQQNREAMRQFGGQRDPHLKMPPPIQRPRVAMKSHLSLWEGAPCGYQAPSAYHRCARSLQEMASMTESASWSNMVPSATCLFLECGWPFTVTLGRFGTWLPWLEVAADAASWISFVLLLRGQMQGWLASLLSSTAPEVFILFPPIHHLWGGGGFTGLDY